jgi:hypothetical protein
MYSVKVLNSGLPIDDFQYFDFGGKNKNAKPIH